MKTLVCSPCYARLQKLPHEVCCFGKPCVVDDRGKVVKKGFNAKAKECLHLCPDRFICRTLFEEPKERNLDD